MASIMCSLSLHRLYGGTVFKLAPAVSSKLLRFYSSSHPTSRASRTDLAKEYDLVIVGGGIVGPALACSIGCEPSLSHKRVLLLQSSPPVETHSIPEAEREQEGEYLFSNRVSVFTQGSVDLLKKVGVWNNIEDVHVKPFTGMHVWDACSDARVVFNSEDIQRERHQEEPSDKRELADDILGSHHHGASKSERDRPSALGYVIENRVVHGALIDALERFSNVQVMRSTRAKVITKVEKKSDIVEVMLNTGRHITTDLLVGSDGPNSRVRQLCRFPQVGWGHNQSALVATLNVREAGSNSTMWQRLLPTGPIALLPLSNTHSSLIWCTSPTHTQSLLEMSPERFVDAVNSAFYDAPPQDDSLASILEDVKEALSFLTSTPTPTRQLPPSVTNVQPSSRAAFSLATGHTPYYVKPRIALVGDATHRVHPIAGQGINLGLGDVASLSQHLVQANSRGDDWGSLSHLLAYETSRQQRKVPTMAAIEGLNRLFSTSFPPLVFVRSLGFILTNAFPQVKELIMEQAK